MDRRAKYICPECGAYYLEPELIGEGYEGKIAYTKFKNQKHYILDQYPNKEQVLWIRSQEFKFIASPSFGKFEIEQYITKMIATALLLGGDISEIFYTSLSCEEVSVSYHQITKKLLAQRFKVIRVDENTIHVGFDYQSLI